MGHRPNPLRSLYPSLPFYDPPSPLHPTASAGFVAEQFLHSTATQLTYHGLCELTSTVQEGELGVFFRNNHFSTMSKYKVT